MSLLSIDIGSRGIAMVQGAVNGGTINIDAAERIPLKPGSVDDGVIKNKTEVINAITNLLLRKTFKAKQTVISITAGNALIREFAVPDGKPKQVESMVRSEMINAFSAVSTDVIEFKKLGDELDENKHKFLRVRAMALSFDLVDSYHEILQFTKLKPVAMDYHANAIEKLIERQPRFNGMDYSDKTFIILDFGYSGVMTYVVFDYRVVATRFIPIGLADFEPIIMDHRYDIQNDTAIDFAKILDFRSTSTADPAIMRATEEVLIQCCNEIQKLIIYSTAKLSQKIMSCAFLYGGGSKIPGIESYLSSELNTEVKLLTAIDGIRFSNNVDETDFTSYINAIGALIRH